MRPNGILRAEYEADMKNDAWLSCTPIEDVYPNLSDGPPGQSSIGTDRNEWTAQNAAIT